ncbi:acetyl-CoA carboxylase biotin carboxyl carrier protein subunit [Nocardiopsis sp. NPDC049922]|uniref:acetyl-CoA carboxylase biotin carboxyl carrier protein n=1 Tax=Nocardiopsis sp. NPDC049922 TaxID=3155157 RepID=UPI0033E8D2C0
MTTDRDGARDPGRTLTAALPPDPEFTYAQLTLGELREEAERLIAGMGRPVRRVRLHTGVSSVEVDWDVPADAPVAAPAAPAPSVGAPPEASETPAAEAASTAHTVRAPLVGTVYLAPEPGAAPFVSVGDRVREGQQLAIVEAMKLMNPIVADRDGVLTRVVAVDAEMVEFDAVLFELGEG